jgi:hypothetical protein
MKTILSILLVITLIATACRDSNSPSVSAIIDSTARRNAVVTDTKRPDTLANMDTTRLVVDAAVNITINGTSISKGRNAVYRAVYDNWLNAYTLVHHLPAVLHMTEIGTVTMGIRENIFDEIVKAQNNMKNYIAKNEYHQSFDSLSPNQQAGLQQQHAILFQKGFR